MLKLPKLTVQAATLLACLEASGFLAGSMIALAAGNGLIVIDAPLWLDIPLTGLALVVYGAALVMAGVGIAAARFALKTALKAA